MYFGMGDDDDDDNNKDSTDMLDDIPTINETNVESNAHNAL